MQLPEVCGFSGDRNIAKIDGKAKRFVAGEAVAAMIRNQPARLASRAFRVAMRGKEIDPDRMSKSSRLVQI
jgi:hypothetical protein